MILQRNAISLSEKYLNLLNSLVVCMWRQTRTQIGLMQVIILIFYVDVDVAIRVVDVVWLELGLVNQQSTMLSIHQKAVIVARHHIIVVSVVVQHV